MPQKEMFFRVKARIMFKTLIRIPGKYRISRYRFLCLFYYYIQMMNLNLHDIIIFNYSLASYNDYSCKLLASLKLRSVLCAGLRDDLDLSNLNGTNKIVKTYKQVKDKHICSHWEDILLSDALYRIEAAGRLGVLGPNLFIITLAWGWWLCWKTSPRGGEFCH